MSGRVRTQTHSMITESPLAKRQNQKEFLGRSDSLWVEGWEKIFRGGDIRAEVWRVSVQSAELEDRDREPPSDWAVIWCHSWPCIPSTTPLITAWWCLHFKVLGAQVPWDQICPPAVQPGFSFVSLLGELDFSIWKCSTRKCSAAFHG